MYVKKDSTSFVFSVTLMSTTKLVMLYHDSYVKIHTPNISITYCLAVNEYFH